MIEKYKEFLLVLSVWIAGVFIGIWLGMVK
jgi:hypothetical protein